MNSNAPLTHRFTVSWQRRSLYAFAAYMLITGMLDSAVLGLLSPQSVTYAAAALTGLRVELSGAFALCALLMLPFMLAQLSPRGYPRWTVLLLCSACFASAWLWVGIAYIAKNTDLGALRWLYLRLAAEAAVFMLLVAAHCNAVLRKQYGLEGQYPHDWRDSNRVPLE